MRSDRKRKVVINDHNEPAEIVRAEVVTPKKNKPRGRPFTGVGDPRNNLKGRPRTGESLAEHVRDWLDHPMQMDGVETTVLDAGLNALAQAFVDGDPAVVKLMLDRGYGKLPETLLLSRASRDEERAAAELAALSEDERTFYFWVIEWAEWCAAGRVYNGHSPFLANIPKIVHEAIASTHIMQVIEKAIAAEKADGETSPSPEGEKGQIT